MFFFIEGREIKCSLPAISIGKQLEVPRSSIIVNVVHGHPVLHFVVAVQFWLHTNLIISRDQPDRIELQSFIKNIHPAFQRTEKY